MTFSGVLQRARKSAYRLFRYHWITERVQHVVRRNRRLKLTAINLELEVEPGSVFIDCGANVGGITSMFARAGATVYAFEPNPMCYDILSKRFSAMPMVHCFNRGVMDRICKLTLSTPRAHGQWDAIDSTVAASFTPGALSPSKHLIQQVEVECIDLSSFIQSLKDQ